MADEKDSGNEPVRSELDPKAILTRIRRRVPVMMEADQTNRNLAIEDMRFATIPGEQWDENQKKDRGKRPCYEFNKVRVNGKRVINEIRANRPSAKVRPVEGGDKKTAETQEGMLRNIWNVSDADTIVDYQAEYQTFAGMGAWRVNIAKSDEFGFYKQCTVENIPNPFTLYADPGCRDIMKRDAADWVLTERIPIAEFEELYPNKQKIDFDEGVDFDDNDDWTDDENVRVVEYWWKEPQDVERWLLTDGKIVDPETDEGQAIAAEAPEMIAERKTVRIDCIYQVIASGQEILSGPTKWPGRFFPFIVVYGDYLIVEGEHIWHGMVRWSKDAQRSYNVSRTSITETIAQAPLAKYWTTPDQAKGHTEKWKEAHNKNFPFQMYNPDPLVGGGQPPQRMGGADVPVALIQESTLASQEIDATMGIFGDDRGEESASQSGRAIYARQQQGRLVTFQYPDNMSKAVQRTYEILLDLVPKVYDTEREIRVLGADLTEDYVQINSFVRDQDGTPIRVNDLSAGVYDVTVTSGPSFTTRRQEATETYAQLGQANPDIYTVAGDLIFRSMDLPYADEISERMKALLPPPVQQMIQAKSGDAMANLPPEALQIVQQAEQAMQQAAELMQAAEAAMNEAGGEKAEAEKAQAKVDKAQANLEATMAKWDAEVAKDVAELTKREARLQVEEIANEADDGKIAELRDFKDRLVDDVSASVLQLNAITTEVMARTSEAVEEVREAAAVEKPKVKEVILERKKGKLAAVPVYDDNTSESAPAGQ